MNFTTDCKFLENELLDVVRLFKCRPETLVHTFSYNEGIFRNAFTVDGQEYAFEDRGQVRDERKFALKDFYDLRSNYGSFNHWRGIKTAGD